MYDDGGGGLGALTLFADTPRGNCRRAASMVTESPRFTKATAQPA